MKNGQHLKLYVRQKSAFLFSLVFFLLGGIPLSSVQSPLMDSPQSALQTSIYYVSPEGNDSGPGTLEEPWQTLSTAAERLKAGDTLYIREGIYFEDVDFSISGTEEAPITISAYPDEKPVIDGNNFAGPTLHWGALMMITGDYNHITGFEVRYSNFMGVLVTGKHSIVTGFDVHHNMENGIFLSGDYTIAEKNKTWMNCLSNQNGNFTRDSWASGLSAGRHPNYAILRDNIVFNNFGEGLSTYEANGTLIEGNVVYDNWSTNIYISDATNVILRNNYIFNTPDEIMASGYQGGITLGDEKYQPPSSNIQITNNLVYGTQTNFYWWQGVEGGGMKDVSITHNTFVNSRKDVNIQISAGTHQNVEVSHNAIIQEDNLPISLVIPSDGLSLHNNLWSKSPDFGARGSGDIISGKTFWLAFIKWTGRGSKMWPDLTSLIADYRWENQPSLLQSDVMPCGRFNYDNQSQNFCN